MMNHWILQFRNVLNRIMEISHMQKEIAEGERDIIKSLITNISHQIRDASCEYYFIYRSAQRTDK